MGRISVDRENLSVVAPTRDGCRSSSPSSSSAATTTTTATPVATTTATPMTTTTTETTTTMTAAFEAKAAFLNQVISVKTLSAFFSSAGG